MFRIGDFSRLAQVSVRTLRLYADLGLLIPAYVDPQTGYRYYALTQMQHLNRILALKDLGLTLEQIAEVLNEQLSADQLRGMFRLKQAEFQQRVQAEQSRLERIAARLQYIEEEGTMPTSEVVVKSIPAQTCASVRQHFATLEAMSQFGNRLHTLLAERRVHAVGPWLHIYHHEGFRETNLDVEIAIPVEAESASHFQAEDNLKVADLPALDAVASLVYVHSPATIIDAYQTIGRWIRDNRYQIVGACREVFLDPRTSTTEIQFPIRRAE